MQPEIEGCCCAGEIWNFRSEAYDDLLEVYNMLSDIPRCDTKTEMLTLIRQSRDLLAIISRRIREKGTDYTLKDAIE